jgi:hypothetical protein
VSEDVQHVHEADDVDRVLGLNWQAQKALLREDAV